MHGKHIHGVPPYMGKQFERWERERRERGDLQKLEDLAYGFTPGARAVLTEPIEREQCERMYDEMLKDEVERGGEYDSEGRT